jgi:hypothetical protein
MKLHALQNSESTAAAQATHKAIQSRSSNTKHTTHRYERRKVREYLRHSVDSDEESQRFERFG